MYYAAGLKLERLDRCQNPGNEGCYEVKSAVGLITNKNETSSALLVGMAVDCAESAILERHWSSLHCMPL